MPTFKIERDLSNLRGYVDNLFDPAVRTAPDSLLDLDPGGEPVLHWFDNAGANMEYVARTLFNVLNNGFDDTSRWNVPSDLCLARFMYSQLKGLSMFVPALHRTGTYDHWEGMTGFKKKYTSPVYRVDGYKRHALSGEEGLYWFVNLFLAGAHFVVLHNRTDLGAPAKDFYDGFANDSLLETYRFVPGYTTNLIITEVVTPPSMELVDERGTATGHSHYTGSVALYTAYSYPKITEDTAPIRCPIVCSLLVDTTASKSGGDYNTFFQLEGWPGVVRGGAAGRHAADFATHQATKWNIATYGLCPYSEKRGTTIFLAPNNWAATVTAGWSMPSYGGARLKLPPWVTAASIASNAGGVLV